MTDMGSFSSADYRKYFASGITYEDYTENFDREIRSGTDSPYADYLPQNRQRQARLDRKLRLRDDVLAVVDKLDQRVHWLLITEHWCGDASQINPVIHKIAKASNGKIMLRLVYRDQHEDLIDAHLTDGRSRSIPILLHLDADFHLVSTYGPRPAPAQALVKGLLAANTAYSIPLHTWYARDKQQRIQDDLILLLSQASDLTF